MAEKKQAECKINWYVSPDIIPRHSTNLVVQVVESEFKLSFFELNPVINLDPDHKPESVRADCVASIFVSPERLAKFIKVMQGQLDTYKSNLALEKDQK